MMYDERICSVALTHIPGLGLRGIYKLIDALGSAADIFKYRTELPQRVPGLPKKLVQALDCPEAFRRAEQELVFCEKNHIRCLTFRDKDYPSRLRECADAPAALFYRGNADLNGVRVINVVGTRHATSYGLEWCNRFLSELVELCPDVLVVSGLAYGIDIRAHHAALQYGFKTVAVLGHGLDRIYPAEHRKTAVAMLERGGLLTEFTSGNRPERQNFVKRNRIVAGMSDASVIVESAVKGGALITARLAESYHRDCFALPGRCDDEYSAGCNNLIKNNLAMLLTSAEDLVRAMNWDHGVPQVKTTTRCQLFSDLNDAERQVIKRLEQAAEGLQINTLVAETEIPVNKMSALLFELELKGVVHALAGGVYKLG